MAKNILKAGFALTVTTRTPGKAELFCKENPGCHFGSLADVAASSDVIIVCVTDTPVSRERKIVLF
jgi:3-hydroxyisobutyrate dehydrogenase-like beta-hydroxyacid dehydrogenase